MRKRKWKIILFFCLCMLMVGCGGGTNTKREVQKIYEKVLENYHEACKLIYVATIKMGEKITDEKGEIYFVVEEPAYQDINSIKNVLESTFSAAYIDKYLSWVLGGEYPLYKEINGRLCIAMADAVGEAPTKEILSILERGEGIIRIVAAGAENETYEIKLIQEEDKWVIDQMNGMDAE